MKTYEFDAVIQKHEVMDAAFIEFPYDVEREFGVRGQVKVKATFDGYEYRGSLAKMGHHCHCLGITREIRKEINKQAGDTVHVVITKDDEPRNVEVPEDFKVLLQDNPAARVAFAGLSYSNQKQYIDWITGGKREETRRKRLGDAITMLASGMKRP